jgi:hypothetical protein
VSEFASSGLATFTGTANFNGVTTMSNGLNITDKGFNVTNSASYIANFTNNSDQNGINIKIAGTSRNANNYVNFQNGFGVTVGRIEGQTVAELENDPNYELISGQLTASIVVASIGAVGASIGFGAAVATAVGAATSSTACAGFGACVTAPIPSFIVAAAAGLVAATAGLANAGIAVGVTSDQKKTFEDGVKANIGVTYQSGSGDYAEWLPKASKNEIFMPGYVVGVKNGMISLNTENADNILAISTSPILLGMMPIEGTEHNYEKVAFMGQVPVHVIGKVKMGDYILPSGRNDGLAFAKSPVNMTAEDYSKIVGMAWSASTNDAYNLINVAIGLNDGDISKLVSKQNEELEKLNEELDDLKRLENESDAILALLIPEYRQAMGLKDKEIVVPARRPSENNHTDPQRENAIEIYEPDPNTIVYFKPTMEQLHMGYEMAKQQFIESGGDISIDAFWSNMESDAILKATYFQELNKNLEKAMHYHKDFNDGGGHIHATHTEPSFNMDVIKKEIINREVVKKKVGRNAENNR